MLTRLLIALGLYTCLLIPSTTSTQATSQPQPAAGTYTVTNYYSDATYTTTVGFKVHPGGCLSPHRSGIITPYAITHEDSCW